MSKIVKSAALALVVVILTTTSSHAINRKKVQAKCPVDGATFSAWEIVSSTDWGGIDTDLCRHEYGSIQPNDLYVWVCPRCRFAAKFDEFATPLADGDKSKVAAALKPAVTFKGNAEQDDIPGWVKYDLLAQTFEALGKQKRHRAEAFLRASWSARQNGASCLREFDELDEVFDEYGLNLIPLDFMKNQTYKKEYGSNRALYDLDKVKKIEQDILKDKLKQPKLQLAQYVVACVYRKHGVNDSAGKWLSILEKQKGQNSVIDDAVTAAIKSIEIETNCQKKAIESYKAALEKNEFKSKEVPEVQYLIGELSRRIQDDRSAIEWFDKCIANPDAKAYKPWAEIQKAHIPGAQEIKK